ncbi:YihY/virulence factor BrkB family protein [Candidatus Halobonum tyrrellensis]|uniref:Ribonuclease BN n=1 Tax=Candidatus Halobonum tyrrellensis G22 TaxID=1324957 RepID=V4J060_9EURY|nr:YihY/virulence factor BrkB family protein [Candidatus Halobonum tyrrellensis]ESP88797.1 ribonuclease BN [Candidatus Halobonum tyrrellensis G22]
MATSSSVVGTAKRVFSDVSEKNVTFMAGGIAYNALVSLAPALLLLLLVVSLVGGGLEARIATVAGEWLPGPIADLVTRVFEGDASAPGASFVGLVVLVWGTLKIFRSLDTAFSEIYETEDENSLVDQLKDGAVVLAALVVAVVAMVGASAAFSVFADALPLGGLLPPLVLVVGLGVAFFPMYYRFPDADVGVSDVVPGVVFAAVGWAALQGLFQVYLTFKNPDSGAFFGGVIVVVTYLYFSGLVLLVGAVVNAALGGHSTGAPGGVGRGATDAETDERSLDGDDLATYLADLREGLTGRYDGMRPTAPAEERPRRAGAVDVTEHTTTDGDTTRRTVTLQWEAEGDADGDSRTDGD